MRSRKALINTTSSLLLELVSVISGFIIPRLILSTFGSSYNGITSSITQFIGYITLLAAGVGGVTRAALYKPLAEKNYKEISAIVRATEMFLRRIALIFSGALLIFASLYPFLRSVSGDEENFSWFFTFSLVIILGLGTFVRYFFGMTYQLVLNADQKQYINTIIQIFTTIGNTVIAYALIKFGAGIHAIKLGASLIFMLNPIIVHIYTKKKYMIDSSVKPNNDAIKQRWDAFAHEIAFFVHGNTDLVFLSFFSNLKEISVYTVYNMVAFSVSTLVSSVSTGIEAAFGNMIAKGEMDKVSKNLNLFEFLMQGIAVVLYSSMGLLITSFVGVYTKGIIDVNYHRPLFGYLLAAVGFFISIRIPYQAVARAAGHYKQTRNGAIIEAAINIVLSLILIQKYGLVGITIGTLVAMIFRSVQYSVYVHRNILKESMRPLILRFCLNIIIISSIVLSIILLKLPTPDTYLSWIVNGFIVFGIALGLTLIFNLIFSRKVSLEFVQFIKNMVKERPRISRNLSE